MKRYTTLQYFKRQDYFDIVVAYNVAPGRFRESAEVKIPSQYIQDGRAGRYISKSFPGYLHAAEKINQLQDIVEEIVVAYVAKNEHKPDSDWVRAEFTRLQSKEIKETVVAPHAASQPPVQSPFIETPQTVIASPFNSRPPIQSVSAASVQLNPNPTHALAAKIVRSLNGGEVSRFTPHQQANPVTTVSAEAIPVVENGDLFRFWEEFMVVRKVVRREDATFNELDSLRSTMEAFANLKNRVLSFGHLDQAFFVDLVHFLIYEYSYSVNPLTMPIVGLRNETAMRRLRDLKTYVDYCVSENYLSLNIVRMERYILVARRKYGVKKLSGTQNWELAFCKEELEFVINLDHYEPEFHASLSPTQRRYVDIILFMCLQGTSPIDTMKARPCGH